MWHEAFQETEFVFDMKNYRGLLQIKKKFCIIYLILYISTFSLIENQY